MKKKLEQIFTTVMMIVVGIWLFSTAVHQYKTSTGFFKPGYSSDCDSWHYDAGMNGIECD